MSKTILFFGNERLATGVRTDVPVLQALLDAGYLVKAVIVAQEEHTSSRNIRELEVSRIAQAHSIPLLALPSLKIAQDEIASYSAKAGVLVAYGKLVPTSIIELFPRGIINIHPSLLPKHRGPTPLESVILNGDSETGVSLMQLSSKMDAGPLYAQQSVVLQGNETKQELADQLLDIGKNMLITHLPAILDGSASPTLQNDQQSTYDQLIDKHAGILEEAAWKQPAARLARMVRAYAGWPRTRARIGTTDIIITAAHAGPEKGIPGTLWLPGKQLGIYCSDGLLVIDSLIPAGKREMPTSAFLAGYKPAENRS